MCNEIHACQTFASYVNQSSQRKLTYAPCAILDAMVVTTLSFPKQSASVNIPEALL